MTWGRAIVEQPTVRRQLRAARTVISYHPRFLPIILRLTPRGVARRIDATTDVVIEGFPRSGNTYSASALRQANPGVRIASHVHMPSQVVKAVRGGVPTLVLVREPEAAVRSLLAAASHVRARTAFEEWIGYYRHVWPYRDRFVIATFEEVIEDFGLVTKRLNHRFGTTFGLFVPCAESHREVLAMMAADHDLYHHSDPRSAPWPMPGRGEAAGGSFDRVDLAALQAEASAWHERYRQLAR